MKLNALFGLLGALLTACTFNGLVVVKPDVDVEIVNQSTRDLLNSRVRFGRNVCEWGYVGKTFSAIYLFYPNPVTHQADLQWEEDDGHRVEKLNLGGIYPAGESGRLTFIVHDDRVEARFTKSQ